MLLKWQENRPDSSTKRRTTAHTAPAFSCASQARPSFLYSTQWCVDTSQPEQSTFPQAPRNSTQIRSSWADSLLTPKSSWHNSLFLSSCLFWWKPSSYPSSKPSSPSQDPQPVCIGFLVLLFPKPHTASHRASVPTFLLSSSSYNYFTDEALIADLFHSPFPLLSEPTPLHIFIWKHWLQHSLNSSLKCSRDGHRTDIRAKLIMLHKIKLALLSWSFLSHNSSFAHPHHCCTIISSLSLP